MGFFIDGRLGNYSVMQSSLNNQKLCDERGWVFVIDGRLSKGGRISLNNQKFRDHRGWEIGMGFCDRWDICQGFSYRSKLGNKQFYDHRGWYFVIDGGLGKDDRSSLNNQHIHYHT